MDSVECTSGVSELFVVVARFFFNGVSGFALQDLPFHAGVRCEETDWICKFPVCNFHRTRRRTPKTPMCILFKLRK